MSRLDELLADKEATIELLQAFYGSDLRGYASIGDHRAVDYQEPNYNEHLTSDGTYVVVNLEPSNSVAILEVDDRDWSESFQDNAARRFLDVTGLPEVIIATGDNYEIHRTYPASVGGDSPNASQGWREGGKDLLDGLDRIGALPSYRLVALAMLLHRNKDGEMWPSYSTIERYTGLARSTVQASVGWLIEHRVLKRTREARRESNEPARYRFTPAKGWKP